jgi:hypothetical protein
MTPGNGEKTDESLYAKSEKSAIRNQHAANCRVQRAELRKSSRIFMFSTLLQAQKIAA